MAKYAPAKRGGVGKKSKSMVCPRCGAKMKMRGKMAVCPQCGYRRMM